MKEISIVGGCFWGTEKELKAFFGVKSTIVGYAVFRHTDNRKWFAMVMIVDKTRLALTCAPKK